MNWSEKQEHVSPLKVVKSSKPSELFYLIKLWLETIQKKIKCISFSKLYEEI